MKPEYFIYKSDGLYYMQNVPAVPDDRDAESLGAYSEMMRQYYKSLERAKAEAYIQCPKDGDLFRKVLIAHGMLQEGNMYTINMEEKIEVVCEGRCKGIKCTIGKVCDGDSSHNCLDKVARIAAPKKEEESEEQVFIVNDLLKPAFKKAELFRRGHNLNGRKINRDQYYEILSELREHINQNFGIKRKPL